MLYVCFTQFTTFQEIGARATKGALCAPYCWAKSIMFTNEAEVWFRRSE